MEDCGVVANMLDYNNLVSKFKLYLYYYIHYQTNTLRVGINLLIPPSYALNSIITVLLQG